MEVKYQMNKRSLTDDLEKLEKLGKLEQSLLRFNLVTGSPYRVEHSLKTIFYFDTSIDEDFMKTSLRNHIADWDIIFILNYKEKKNLMLVNSSLPIIKEVQKLMTMAQQNVSDEPFRELEATPLVIFLNFIALSTPEPLTVDLSYFFLSLAIIPQMLQMDSS